MNTVEVEELIIKYRKNDILNCDSQIDNSYIEMLLDLCDNPRGCISLLVNTLWFYSHGDLGTKNYSDLDKADLVEQMNELKKKVLELEKVISTYNGNMLQRAKVKNGMKIAFKKEVSIEKVQELRNQGLSYEQIAEKLNVSRATIGNRIREIKKQEENNKRKL
ncbi:MAG: HTH domain-containing protein [Mobilitalea sp.]